MGKKKILFLLLALGLLLRLPGLHGSLWLDEAAQALESARPFSQQFRIAADYQPPLFHLLVHFLLQVSREEWWLRLPSLISGILSVGMLFLLLEEKLGKKTAMLGSFLLATSPFHIFYSQELRPYALATFFACLSWYVLLSERFEKKRWLWYTLVTTLGIYTMYLYPFNVLAQFAYIFFEKRSHLKPIACALVAVASAFLPWIPSFLGQLQSGVALTGALPGWSSAVATPQLKALPLTFGKFLVGQVPFSGNMGIIISTAGILLLGCVLSASVIKDKQVRFLFYWVGVPILSTWLLSFVLPIIQPKRVMIALPAFLTLFVIGKTRTKYLLVGLVIGLQLFTLLNYYRNPALGRENWKALVGDIEREAKPNSVALFSFPDPFAPWQWYASGSVKTVSTGQIYLDKQWDPSSANLQLTNVTTIYLFDYLRDLTDPTRRLEKTLADLSFQEVSRIDGHGIGFVRVFARMNTGGM